MKAERESRRPASDARGRVTQGANAVHPAAPDGGPGDREQAKLGVASRRMDQAARPQVTDALALLRERYRAASGNTVAAFEALARQLRATPDAAEVTETLRRELHRVRGTAGTYGFAEASALAASLEERAIRWHADPALERDRRAAIIEHFAGALRLAFAAPVSADAAPAAPDAPPPAMRRLIAAVSLPAEALQGLRAEAVLQGFEVVSRAAEEWTVAEAERLAPHAVVTSVERLRLAASALAGRAVPIVALERAGERTPGAVPPGVTLLDASSDGGAILQVLRRATLASGWAGATVLVLDDDPSILAMVRHVVEEAGIRVVTLADPAPLDELLAAERPSLLLMDKNLGGVDGIELAARLRRDPRWEELPIVMFSSELDAATRERAYAARADEYIPKPIVPEELRRRVADRLERQRARALERGFHPGTGIPLPQRTSELASTFLEERRRRGAPVVAALLRPVGPEPEGEAARRWLAECHRIAARLAERPAFLGYTDTSSLLLIVEGEMERGVVLLDELLAGRDADAPEWRAGYATSDDVGGAAYGPLAGAARDARDLAEAGDRPLRRWNPEDATAAPDVVIVEDDRALVDMLQYALRSGGWSHRAFATGVEALDALLAMRTGGRRPVVLLDVELPGLDGHTLHERLRVERPGAFAVVFVTGHAAEADQLRALRAGAVDYVAKPVSLRVLVAKLPLWMQRAGSDA